MPPPWNAWSTITSEQLREYLRGAGERKTERTNPRFTAHQGYRDDLGHRCRSQMEADWGRFLRFNGYQHWTAEGEDIPEDGKWYRYEGRRFEFLEYRGAASFYISDYEVWPGFFDTERGYEIHEVKGYLDPQSKTKLKRMGLLRPEIALVLVTQDVFAQNTSGAAHSIPYWGS